MLNLCHIFSLKGKKICAFVLIMCLIWGLTPIAESISVKLRGKVALGGILSGLAYVTYALVTRDRRAAERLKVHLGPPDRVIQFERGFDRWRVNYYGEQCYLFRNNLFIETTPCTSLRSENRDYEHQPQVHLGTGTGKFNSPFLSDTPVLGSPRWLRLFPLHLQRDPQFGVSYLYRLADERLLGLEP